MSKEEIGEEPMAKASRICYNNEAAVRGWCSFRTPISPMASCNEMEPYIYGARNGDHILLT